MKNCLVCGVTQELSNYHKCTQNKDGRMNQCKQCSWLYRRSYKGKIGVMYSSQIFNSKKRLHKAPTYSLEEFTTWLEASGYVGMYDQWKKSNYEKRGAPSADRIDDKLPYSLSNLRLITWGENNDKAHADFISGKLYNKHTPVRQLTKEGHLIAVHVSQLAAERATGVLQGNIGTICRSTSSRRKTAGGFKWEYVNERTTA